MLCKRSIFGRILEKGPVLTSSLKYNYLVESDGHSARPRDGHPAGV